MYVGKYYIRNVEVTTAQGLNPFLNSSYTTTYLVNMNTPDQNIFNFFFCLMTLCLIRMNLFFSKIAFKPVSQNMEGPKACTNLTCEWAPKPKARPLRASRLKLNVKTSLPCPISHWPAEFETGMRHRVIRPET